MIGREVDHYRILGHLGGGGMGVVYKAEDTRLQRTVALKFLPPAMTRDAVAKSRFLQEARAASALDHPNVCTIYDIGEVEGGQLYIAMPAYDGDTLKKRIERDPLPIDEAVDVARQLAQGLSKAHRQGIVHRDIKPANLMLTGDGLVKILDFGLAKLAGSAGLTRAGFCVGTPSYMSPEQARGDVDHRTDLWSLGVVLYEMLTGLLPFRAESDPGIINALLHDEPAPIRRWRRDVPPELERIVDGLLRKDPGDRYPTADHVVAELRALGGPPTMSFPSIEQHRPLKPLNPLIPLNTHRPGRSRRWGWPWIAAAGAGVLASAVLAGYLVSRFRAAPPVQEDVLLTRDAGSERQPSLGDDFFVYTKVSGGDTDIFWQRLDGTNARNLTEDSAFDESSPAVSPDGLQIAFRSERDGGGIFLMGATGESPRRLTHSGYDPAWSPDGSELLIAAEAITAPSQRASESRLWRVDLSDGKATLLETGDAVQPSWSPGGRRITYWGSTAETGRRSIWTSRLDGSEPVEVIGDREHLSWKPTWSADGRFLYFLSNRGGSMNVWRTRIDEASGRILGEPEAVRVPARQVSGLSLGRDGQRILYATDDSKSNVERAELDPATGEVLGGLTPVTTGSWSIRSAQISPDGDWIAFDTESPQEDLFILRTDGTDQLQLTRDPHKDRIPRWSPDGRSLVFYSNRGSKYEAWRIQVDGSGLTRLTQLDRALYNPIWSPDGRQLAVNLDYAEGAVLDLDRPLERRRPRLLTESGKGAPTFAPDSWSADGRWLAGYNDEGICLYSFDARRFERIPESGVSVTWLRDGKRLIYLDQYRLRLFDLVSRTSREILAPPPPESKFLRVSVSSDSRRLCLVRRVEEGDIGLMTFR